MSAANILSWLDNIPYTNAPMLDSGLPTTTRKLPRPLTPDSIDVVKDDSDNDTSRKGQQQDTEDQDVTPRGKRLQTNRAESHYSLTSGSSASSRSSAQSPQKQIKALSRVNDNIEPRELSSLRCPPQSLKEFLRTMRHVSQGQGMLSPSIRDVISAHPDDDAAELGNPFFFSDQRDLLGHTPSLEQITEILDAAAECQGKSHAEATWNIWVHDKLLRLALIQPGCSLWKQMIGFMPCSTAAVLSEYLPSLKIPKKVDFCIYVDPSCDEKLDRPTSQSLVSTMCNRMTEGAINHTDYAPLMERPLALSIETRKLGEGWHASIVQMSVWQAAQWNLLDQITPPGHRADEVLDFLPGIIIQGHNWYLVITTREGKKTIYWNKLDIGATDTIEGVYKIIYGLQILRQWARDTFWPALRNRIAFNIKLFDESLARGTQVPA
ncbi:hypothetical protein F66182_4942 [Fusarium sp. NRRL 66182]|nr:hypothetical protein F66182_4942 [Fusarium sp. NRRL 66182]